MRYTFKNRLPGRKHVLEIRMQYNIHMQYNSVTFLHVQYSKTGHKYMLTSWKSILECISHIKFYIYIYKIHAWQCIYSS